MSDRVYIQTTLFIHPRMFFKSCMITSRNFFRVFFGYILYTVVKCYNRPRFARVSNPLRFSQFVRIRGGSNHAEILAWEEKMKTKYQYIIKTSMYNIMCNNILFHG